MLDNAFKFLLLFFYLKYIELPQLTNLKTTNFSQDNFEDRIKTCIHEIYPGPLKLPHNSVTCFVKLDFGVHILFNKSNKHF